jgi:hypothetical protein
MYVDLLMPSLQLGLPAVALILTVLWVLGSISSLTLGGGLHVLLVAAIAMMVPRILWGRKPVK